MVGGTAAAKAATQVAVDAAITVRQEESEPGYVSRGGHKLAGALAAFGGLTVAARRCLDAGASTGGFTDVLLGAGAAEVVAVDVGYGQLAWSLRNDPRVHGAGPGERARPAAGAGGPAAGAGRRPTSRSSR